MRTPHATYHVPTPVTPAVVPVTAVAAISIKIRIIIIAIIITRLPLLPRKFGLLFGAGHTNELVLIVEFGVFIANALIAFPTHVCREPVTSMLE